MTSIREIMANRAVRDFYALRSEEKARNDFFRTKPTVKNTIKSMGGAPKAENAAAGANDVPNFSYILSNLRPANRKLYAGLKKLPCCNVATTAGRRP